MFNFFSMYMYQSILYLNPRHYTLNFQSVKFPSPRHLWWSRATVQSWGHTMQSNAPTRKGKSPLQTTPFSFHSPVPRIIILLIICLTINKQKKWLNFQSYAKISKDPKYSKNSLVSVRFSTEATYSNTPSPSQVLLNY